MMLLVVCVVVLLLVVCSSVVAGGIMGSLTENKMAALITVLAFTR